MKLKFIYGMIFGIWGSIIACLAGYSVIFITFWICVKFLSIDVTSCDLWTHIIFPSIFLLSFLFFFIKSILHGMKHGAELDEDEDKAELVSKAKRWLIVAFIVLFFSIALLTKVLNDMRKDIKLKNERYSELISRVNIDSFSLMNTGTDAVGVVAEIEGTKESKCELILKLFSYGHIKEKLLEVKGDFTLNNEKKEKSFYVPFSEIEKNYYRVLLKDVPAFNENKDMEEYIVFELRLKLLESEGYNKNEVLDAKLRDHVKSGAARFLFSCTKESCKIIQEQEKDKSEQ